MKAFAGKTGAFFAALGFIYGMFIPAFLWLALIGVGMMMITANAS